MISIERNFDMKRIDAYIAKRVEDRILEVVELLRTKGLEYTELARSKTLAANPYNNITWNLVSSIGFTIAMNGAVIVNYYPLLNTGTEGVIKGQEVGEREAQALSSDNSISLVLVAGEDYASYVQDLNSKDVTKMASLKFESFLTGKWGAFQ